MFSRTCIRFSSLVLVLVVALTALPGLPGGAVAAAASSEDFRAPAEFSVLAAASHLLALVDHMAGEAMTWAEPTTPSPLRLQVDADTVPATPGDIVTVTVSAQYRGVEATDLQVSGVLPRGLDFVAGGDGVVWSPRLAAIFWEVEELAPGQTATAQFQAQVTAVGPGVHLDLNLEADGNRLPDLVAGTVRIPVLPSRATQVTVRPSQAGNLEVDGGRLRVHVPAGTSAAGLTLRPAWRRPAAQQLYAFDLNVTPPVRFQRPVAVALRLAQGDGRVLASGSLTLRRFDPQSGEWQPVETSLDAETDTLTAELYEGGLLAVTEENESSYLKGMLTPSVLGLQASLWTGDSSYSYPLALPPAPGGQSPALALTYSSGAANSMLEADLHDRSAQASDLGLGWQIAGAGYITRSGDGRHFLNMDGASYELVSCTDPQCSPDEWKTEPESFLQVLHDKDYKVQVGTDSIYGNCTNHQQGYVDIKARDTVPWTVRTKDGTTYTFGSDVDANGLPVDSGATPYHWVYGGERSEVPGDCSGSAGDLLGKVKMRPYRWNLVTVQPPAGPAWHYQYGSKRMKLRY
ncbi:MAG: hypothetical protein ACK2U9_04225, partial [Anaerolineae bacterium]